MTQGIENREKAPQELPEELQTLYGEVQGQLAQVDDLLREQLHSDHPFVDRLLKHGFRLGGKRLRPALVLLAGQACGGVREEHITLGAVVEMIHTATLIHDDVLDEAALRRHLDTVNARWDNEASVLLGDYLFTRAVCLAASLPDTFACQLVGKASQIMCEGELRQIATRGNYDLGEQLYLDIIADKTAALCSCCCRLGAHYAGADQEICRALAQFGQNLGIAFQIVDDVLDVQGDEATTGKSLGTDFVKQKATLPLIRLLDQIEPDQRAEVIQILSRSEHGHREAIRPWLERSDAIAYARETAVSYTQAATEQLAVLPASPAKDGLLHIADFVIARHL